MAVVVNGISRTQPADPERAFERLFAAEYGKVVAIAYRILADMHAAEDVAQDVFYAYHRRHAPDAPFAAAWLHKAAAHTAYNAAISRTRRERRDQTTLVAGSEGDPQQAVEVAEQRRIVGEALGRLPEHHATILGLRYGGLSYAEVAQALGVGINQVGARLNRAEAALRKELTRDASG
jgi:RNA polymerase sigma-70 factor (ECF subfamily)